MRRHELIKSIYIIIFFISINSHLASQQTHASITSMCSEIKIKGGKRQIKNRGTDVPLIVFWKNHVKENTVINYLVDFTDIYPTLTDFLDINLGKTYTIDGVSISDQLLGIKGKSKKFAICHYQPHWNRNLGQFARTSQYKLYNHGRFYIPSIDLEEKNNTSLIIRTL